MKTIDSKPEKLKLCGSDEIKVEDFIQDISKKRSRRYIDEEYAEDEVLGIVNHKRRWKKTLSKKLKRIKKIKHMEDKFLRLN